jgi:hypothetical protein
MFTDNGCQVTVIRHMTFIFLIRVVSHLVDSLFWGVVPLSREARSYFYSPGFPRGNGGCSLNLYTQLYVCKYQQLKHLYCSIQHDQVCQTCGRSVVFSAYSTNKTRQPWYRWNIVKSGIKHHNSPIFFLKNIKLEMKEPTYPPALV